MYGSPARFDGVTLDKAMSLNSDGVARLSPAWQLTSPCEAVVVDEARSVALNANQSCRPVSAHTAAATDISKSLLLVKDRTSEPTAGRASRAQVATRSGRTHEGVLLNANRPDGPELWIRGDAKPALATGGTDLEAALTGPQRLALWAVLAMTLLLLLSPSLVAVVSMMN